MAERDIHFTIDLLHNPAVIIIMILAVLATLKLGAEVLAPLVMAARAQEASAEVHEQTC